MTLFPVVCLAWAGTVFVFQAVVNGVILDRDPGLGDSSKCPLPNGYMLLLIDVSDRGTVYNPKTQRISDSISDQQDAISGVSALQVAGPYIFGTYDPHYFDNQAGNSRADITNKYFQLILAAELESRSVL